MTDIAIIDSFVKPLIDSIKSDVDGNLFDAPALNGKYQYIAEIAKTLTDATVSSSPEKLQILFENLSPSQIARDFAERWSSDIGSWMTYFTVVCEKTKLEEFTSSLDYKKFSNEAGDFPISITTRETSFSKDGKEYVMTLFRPHFPQWYIYTLNNEYIKADSRTPILLSMREAFMDTFDGEARLQSNDIDGLYYFLVKDHFGNVSDASATNADAKNLMQLVGGVYALCAIEMTPDTIFDLPMYYKEFLIVSFKKAMTGNLVDQLQRSLTEARAA
jgi:hypothetical protein